MNSPVGDGCSRQVRSGKDVKVVDVLAVYREALPMIKVDAHSDSLGGKCGRQAIRHQA